MNQVGVADEGAVKHDGMDAWGEEVASWARAQGRATEAGDPVLDVTEGEACGDGMRVLVKELPHVQRPSQTRWMHGVILL